jgi:hypothetical protein
MKKILWTVIATAAVTVALVYGRWVVSDLLWLHEQRMDFEKQQAFLAGQQDAVRQIKAAQGGK